jgi:hypothetical protein
VIAQVPSVIPSAHVISSLGCPADAAGVHFSILGYRIMGKRYANKMLELIKATRLESCENIILQPDGTYSIPVTAYFEDGHSEDVTARAVVTKVGTGLTVSGNVIKAVTNERSLVTVSFTDLTGATLSKSFFVNKSGSPLGMITDVVNRILKGDKSVNVADIVRIINDK